MEGELILVAIIMLVGAILLSMNNNSNWFKKENFKMQKKLVMDSNKLKIKKLEKELGLTSKPITTTSGLDLKELANTFLGSEEGEEPEGISGMLLDFAKDNPDIVQGILSGISNKKDINKGNDTVY